MLVKFKELAICLLLILAVFIMLIALFVYALANNILVWLGSKAAKERLKAFEEAMFSDVSDYAAFDRTAL